MHAFALIVGLTAGVSTVAAPTQTQSRVLIPSVYESGHVYATPETVDGKSLRLLVDTGGGGSKGWYMLDSAAAQRLGFATKQCGSDEESIDVIPAIAWREGKGIPILTPPPCHSVALVIKGFGKQLDNADGMLGAGYLSSGIWTFDYPGKQLWLESSGWRADVKAHRDALGFQRDASGSATTGMARITLQVDGQPLQMLLDTGATAKPTAAGQQASGTPTTAGYGVTSYITSSMLERWHQQHPDWRVVSDGDGLFGDRFHARLIEVPTLVIAGWTIGPVWFTERPDPAFHTYMSTMMDQPIEGAVGGNVLAHFTMTIDYPAAVAWFACTDCVAAAE